ncbi:stage V sporulation protein D (sporulation-specific penicillin-binding protein) [Selenomonas ruminantium]|uniref:Stage V sporulation protein D (Sporulation-specific penicillin-binding protein) n=1 Tax=Selenomonas ruminantium TaxID=971 RepID=A0A1M6TD79_SELRU|nr:penicillin-binding transpeptidase domain-containing protein [Selenomonas ruminantium]SHK54930.1 stage V sporulation protein D (sporulation-specific penicillin-binding protein) [Selenomonas ruminantium]
MKKERRAVQRRISFLAFFMLLGVGLIVCRYAWLQLVQGNSLGERMKAQVGQDYAIQSPRGAIVDRNGREMAVSTMTKSLYIDPSHVENPQEVAANLAPLIGKSEQEILDDIAVGGGFVWVKRRMEQSEYEAVRQLIKEKNYISCMNFREEAKRYYPNDALAANVLGFIGTDDKGLDGVEQALDSLLKGEVKETYITTDQQARPILDSIFSNKRRYMGDACKTVELTIDSGIQFIVEQELDRAIAENNPKAITCVVMDPKNGEILAMASRPSYNPNKFWDYSPELWKNRAVSFIYEPGSTFKSVVAGAALQEKVVSPNQVFVDPGYVMVSGRRIQNWNGESFGTVTFTDVVKQSLNTGFAQVGLRLGAEKLMSYAKAFGFGEPTGVDLPGEESGILFNPEDMRDSDMATTAIGQSIAVTPLQLVTAMSAIANDGVLLKPHIVKSIRNADGSTYEERGKTEVRRVIDSATDKTLMGLLEQVVASGGGAKAQVKGYRIGGKTGTAQKIREDGSGYMDGRYIASFCGFAPVEDPQLVVLVVIDDPGTGNFYGGQIAAPVAGRIFSQLFRHLHIEPSSDPFAGMEPAEKKQPVHKPARPFAGEVPEGKVVVPDFRGKSLREAAGLAADKGLSFQSEGSGYATGQSIEVNTLVDGGTSITVYFEPD